MPYWRLFYHVIWATQNRQPLIEPRLQRAVWRAVRQSAERGGGSVYAVGGVQDHIHLVLTIPPSIAVAETIRWAKGGSSHVINAETGGGFAWQAEYGVVSFSERHLSQVVAYVNNQASHHSEQSLWPSLEQITDVGPNTQPA